MERSPEEEADLMVALGLMANNYSKLITGYLEEGRYDKALLLADIYLGLAQKMMGYLAVMVMKNNKEEILKAIADDFDEHEYASIYRELAKGIEPIARKWIDQGV